MKRPREFFKEWLEFYLEWREFSLEWWEFSTECRHYSTERPVTPWNDATTPWNIAATPWSDAATPWSGENSPRNSATIPWNDATIPWNDAIFPLSCYWFNGSGGIAEAGFSGILGSCGLFVRFADTSAAVIRVLHFAFNVNGLLLAATERAVFKLLLIENEFDEFEKANPAAVQAVGPLLARQNPAGA